MILKTCSKCGAVMPYGSAKCQACKAAMSRRSYEVSDKRRDPRIVSFRRSALWRRTRDAALDRDNYQCIECNRRGVVTPATDAHHIIPMCVDWGKRADLDNIVSVCSTCHRRLDSLARRLYARPQGVSKK